MNFWRVVDEYFFEIPGIFIDEGAVIDVVHKVFEDEVLGLVNGAGHRGALSDFLVLD